MIVIFIGPPGCGKGTQSNIIAPILSYKSVQMSGILSEISRSDSNIAVELRGYMDAGKLVPSILVNEIISTYLRDLLNMSSTTNVILDGYPRTTEQAEFLTLNFNVSDIKIVYFDMDYDSLLKRIEGRFICQSCGAIYNEFFNTTKLENTCDVCHGNVFIKRKDDKLTIFTDRWSTYLEETFPLIEYFSAKCPVLRVDASLPTDVVTRSIIDWLESM